MCSVYVRSLLVGASKFGGKYQTDVVLHEVKVEVFLYNFARNQDRHDTQSTFGLLAIPRLNGCHAREVTGMYLYKASEKRQKFTSKM